MKVLGPLAGAKSVKKLNPSIEGVACKAKEI